MLQSGFRLATLHRCGSGFAHRTPLLKTLAAIYGAPLRRLERYCGFLPALRTNGFGLDTLHSIAVTISVSCSSVCLARFAPLGFVLKTLVGEKHLFAGGENELGTTFGAFQNPILIFHTLLLGSHDKRSSSGTASARRRLVGCLSSGLLTAVWLQAI
jgi:hypothetical protein